MGTNSAFQAKKLGLNDMGQEEWIVETPFKELLVGFIENFEKTDAHFKFSAIKIGENGGLSIIFIRNK